MDYRPQYKFTSKSSTNISNMSQNIYEHITTMRRGMRAIGRTREEIDNACTDVTNADSYEDALTRIKKYWK